MHTRFDYRGNWSFTHLFDDPETDYGGVGHLDDIRFFLTYLPMHNRLFTPEVPNPMMDALIISTCKEQLVSSLRLSSGPLNNITYRMLCS